MYHTDRSIDHVVVHNFTVDRIVSGSQPLSSLWDTYHDEKVFKITAKQTAKSPRHFPKPVLILTMSKIMIEDNNDSDEEDDNRKKAKVGSFQSMGLEKELMWGISRMGYKVPTPVQRKALPIVLAGMDMVCMARTGSGKTCVFLLPLMQKVKKHDPTSGVRAVVLSPTRCLPMTYCGFFMRCEFNSFTELIL